MKPDNQPHDISPYALLYWDWTLYCHGSVKARVRVSVWVRVKVRVKTAWVIMK